jgi:hypothetical protein
VTCVARDGFRGIEAKVEVACVFAYGVNHPVVTRRDTADVVVCRVSVFEMKAGCVLQDQ